MKFLKGTYMKHTNETYGMKTRKNAAPCHPIHGVIWEADGTTTLKDGEWSIMLGGHIFHLMKPGWMFAKYE